MRLNPATERPRRRPTLQEERPPDGVVIRTPVPGALWPWVKGSSWVELALFASLLVFWLAPGFEGETKVFGWAHGLGFLCLCLLIWSAILRREAPYWLLAATLTPVGPLGSVIGIVALERRRRGAPPTELPNA